MITRCYLEITNICNLNCVFCPKTTRAKHTLTIDEFDTLTTRLMGEVRFLYFHLMGEPFLHPLLPQFVLTARRKGFIPVLTTNGTLLSQRTDMLDALPHKLQISLHSHEGNGKENLKQYIDEMMTFASEAARRGYVVVLRLWNEGGRNSMNESILKFIAGHQPQPWTERYDGWKLADGTVVPCCLDHNGDMGLGNLFEHSLADILASPRAAAIYNGFTCHTAVEPLCQRCGYSAVSKRFRKQ